MITVHFIIETILLILQCSPTFDDRFEYNFRRDKEFIVNGVLLCWNKVIKSKYDELKIRNSTTEFCFIISKNVTL